MTIEFNKDEFPRGCVEDCASAGRSADLYVAQWLGQVGLALSYEDAIAYLIGTGGWDREDVDDPHMTVEDNHERNLQRVFWCLCCDINESRDGVAYMEGV